jgi:hypothetical protein
MDGNPIFSLRSADLRFATVTRSRGPRECGPDRIRTMNGWVAYGIDWTAFHLLIVGYIRDQCESIGLFPEKWAVPLALILIS